MGFEINCTGIFVLAIQLKATRQQETNYPSTRCYGQESFKNCLKIKNKKFEVNINN